MNVFLGDLVNFIGRRIKVANKTIRPRLEATAETDDLSAEEADNFNESIEQEAIYLIGLADGLELSQYFTTTNKVG